MNAKQWYQRHHHQPSSPPSPCHCPLLKFPSLSSFHPGSFSAATRYRRWDSNAEQSFSSGSRNGKYQDQDGYEEDEDSRAQEKRRWWSDEDEPPYDAGVEVGGWGWEDVIDSFWILKVFRSYGWWLPVILSSFLLATGPKAFLMALALPLGQSALSLAFEKLFGRPERRTKRKARTRKKPFSSKTVSNNEMEEEVEESGETRKGSMGYQSWVGRNDDSVKKGDKDMSSFGGWEDLDQFRNMRRQPGGSRSRSVKKAKLSRKERRSDTPLFMRLLIAVFPFLSSWTKML